MKYARLAFTRPLVATSLLLLALLTGCDIPEDVPPPNPLLPKEQVVSVLIELHILEARVEASRLSLDSARALFQQQKSAILWKHNIIEKDSLLQRSFRYYAVNHKDMDEIYKAVVDSLEQREKQLNGGVAKQPDHPQ